MKEYIIINDRIKSGRKRLIETSSTDNEILYEPKVQISTAYKLTYSSICIGPSEAHLYAQRMTSRRRRAIQINALWSMTMSRLRYINWRNKCRPYWEIGTSSCALNPQCNSAKEWLLAFYIVPLGTPIDAFRISVCVSWTRTQQNNWVTALYTEFLILSFLGF